MSASRRIAPRTDQKAQRGLTLLELLLVLGLLALFGVAVYDTVVMGLRVASATDHREEIRQEVANALERFTREASMADVVDYSTNSRFQFDADLDGNGTVETDINYQVTSGTLQRTYAGRTLTLIPDLGSLDFDYINASGAEYDDYDSGCGGCARTNIRVVQINVTATQNSETITTGSAAFLRNNY